MPSTTSATDQTTRGFAAQLPRNLAANIAYFLVNIVIGILLVPYFIDTLGVAAYGLIPLATSITGYVAIVVQSLNTAVTRFPSLYFRPPYSPVVDSGEACHTEQQGFHRSWYRCG